MPAPDFVRPIVPAPFWIAPPNVELAVEEVVRVDAPAVELVMIAPLEPLSEPTVTLKPFRLSVPALTARLPLPRASALPSCNVPAETVVAPV